MINKTSSIFSPISEATDLDSLIDKSHDEPVVVFKHSLTCELSARAYRKLSRLEGSEDLTIHLVAVQTARPLSNRIEADLGVRHESPQLLVIYKGTASFDSSHHKVTSDILLNALESVRRDAA